MERILIKTDDGSHTLFLPEIDEHYHSTHGAIQESKHVFIEAGLKQMQKNELTIFEVGFGTGLNSFLTYLETENTHLKINYYCIEKYPLTDEIYQSLNYADEKRGNEGTVFQLMHHSSWNVMTEIDARFNLTKIDADIITFDFSNLPQFDLIYFDAFAPNKQPELWTSEMFQQLYNKCNPGGILVTYCAKGEIRRKLQSVGFNVERLNGPPGKREMLRGIK